MEKRDNPLYTPPTIPYIHPSVRTIHNPFLQLFPRTPAWSRLFLFPSRSYHSVICGAGDRSLGSWSGSVGGLMVGVKKREWEVMGYSFQHPSSLPIPPPYPLLHPQERFHKDNLRHLSRFPDFFVTKRILTTGERVLGSGMW